MTLWVQQFIISIYTIHLISWRVLNLGTKENTQFISVDIVPWMHLSFVAFVWTEIQF